MTQSNYGVQVTQQGISVDSAADFQFNLNSSWPTLEVILEKVIDQTVSASAAGALVVSLASHKLDYIPAFQWVEDGNVGSDTYDVSATTTDIVFYRDVGAGEVPYTFRLRGTIRVFNWNILQSFKADITSIGSDLPKKSDYGIAVLGQDARDIESNQYQDFSLHSGAKSLTIHQSGVVEPDATSAIYTIEHGLGYLPSYQTYYLRLIGDDGTYNPATAAKASSNPTTLRATQIGHINGNTGGNEATMYSTGDGRNLTFRGWQAAFTGAMAYVLFKDPVLKTDS